VLKGELTSKTSQLIFELFPFRGGIHLIGESVVQSFGIPVSRKMHTIVHTDFVICF